MKNSSVTAKSIFAAMVYNPDLKVVKIKNCDIIATSYSVTSTEFELGLGSGQSARAAGRHFDDWDAGY